MWRAADIDRVIVRDTTDYPVATAIIRTRPGTAVRACPHAVGNDPDAVERALAAA